MRSGVVASGIVLIVVAGVFWILVSTGSFIAIRIPIGGGEVVVQENEMQLSQIFNFLAILLGLIGLVLLIAGLIVRRPEAVFRETQRRHVPPISQPPDSQVRAAKYCKHCGTPIDPDSVFCRACGRNVV